MIARIRRKNLQYLFIASTIIFITISLISTKNLINDETRTMIAKFNYFDKVYSKYWLSKTDDEINTLDKESKFNKQVNEMLKTKKLNDLENKFFILNTHHDEKYDINIPSYYFNDHDVDNNINDNHQDIQGGGKPELQPFDPRFTLTMYINYLKHQLDKGETEVSVPFHWYDWVDLSLLNKHLLAPDDKKPTCDILDARDDEARLNKEAEEKKKLDEQELLEYEKSKQTDNKADTKQENKEDNKEKNKEETKGETKEDNKQDNDKNKEDKPKSEEKKENSKEEKENEKDKRFVKRDAHNPKDFCLNNDELSYNFVDGNKLRPGFNVFKPAGKVTQDIGLLIGKSYLYSFAPSPTSIIFLTEDGTFNMTINNERSKLLDNNLVETYIKNNGKSKSNSKINLLDDFKKLNVKHKSNKYKVINDYEINLKPDDFNVDFDSIIDNYEIKLMEGKSIPKNEINYFRSLQYSQHEIQHGGPPKYFSESRILRTNIGDHYDFRFFNGIMFGTYEQTLTLHRLIRAFLSFSRKNGLNTWVAHGSLLSWYWNGIAFPWDNDIDVQMPINDLHRLSRDFNQTLIVEDINDGMGRYFLDCGSFITLRNKGNGNNNIDARFIDIDTGLYIDITGLAVSKTKPSQRYLDSIPEDWGLKDFEEKDINWFNINEKLKVYNCRDNHFTLLDEINPLVKTTIEGETGYIPKKFTEILNVEYSKGLKEKKFKNHVFLPQLRLWINEEDLYYFLKDKEKWNNYHNYNEYYINHKMSENFNFDFNNFKYELTSEERKQLQLEAKLREKHKEKDKIDSNSINNSLNNDETNLILNFSYDELIALLNKDEILMNYVSTRDFTSFHEEEMMRLLFGKSTQKLIHDGPDFKPMKLDPFMFKIYNDYWDYNQEVEKYIDLINIYKAN